MPKYAICIETTQEIPNALQNKLEDDVFNRLKDNLEEPLVVELVKE